MQVFYFLTPMEHFGLLKKVAADWSAQIGISFRRFSASGFEAGYETCSWNEDLAAKYLDGGYSEIYLSANKSVPKNRQDWDFSEREVGNLIIIEGGRSRSNELEQTYLRVFAKKSKCVPLYRRLRKSLKDSMNQGLYAGRHHYREVFYSDIAAGMRMVDRFGGNEFLRTDHITNG